MSDMSIDQVLAQMRAMAARAQAQPSTEAAPPAGVDFSQMLKNSIAAVNSTQKQAGQMTEAFQRGEPGVELANVMIALKKANVSFTAMTQVRNKLVDAYHEIMRMQG